MLDVELNGPVLTLTMNRPEVRNAINDEAIEGLTKAFTELGSGVRCVVLQGAGKSFCSGGDLEWMRKAANYTEEKNYQDALKLAALFHSISHCPAFVIARVHGAAYGGGSGLVAAADIAVASAETMFAFSEVKLGLIAGTISPYVIPKIGAGHARALFGTGEAFGTERALRIGLIHEVGDLDELVARKVRQVLSVGPHSVKESKRLVNEAPLPVAETARRLARARASAEGKEGVAAFLEKRKASFVVDP